MGEMKVEKAVSEMSAAELIEKYNSLAPRMCKPKVKRFATTAVGRKRVAELIASQQNIGESLRVAAAPKAPKVERVVAVENEPVAAAEGVAKKEHKKSGVVGFAHAEATADGRTVLQKDSVRRKVFEALAALGGKQTIEALHRKLGFDPRPHLIKLRMFGHIKTFNT